VTTSDSKLISDIREVLRSQVDIQLAILFGSVARHEESRESDIDIAVDLGGRIFAERKIEMVQSLAAKTGRAIDLIDLQTVGEPLLGKILRDGVSLFGDTSRYAALIRRHLIDAADFTPYRDRILRERRNAWTTK